MSLLKLSNKETITMVMEMLLSGSYSYSRLSDGHATLSSCGVTLIIQPDMYEFLKSMIDIMPTFEEPIIK